MDFDKYLSLYPNVSRAELEKIWTRFRPGLDFQSRVSSLDSQARMRHENREREKLHGTEALLAGPQIHVLSVSVQPREEQVKPLAIYGTIAVQFPDFVYAQGMIGHDFYKCERDTPQLLDTTGGNLVLNGPSSSCDPRHAYIPLFGNRIDVGLFDGDHNVFARETFSLEDAGESSDFDEVKSKCIPCEQGSLTIHYIAMPFAVHCRVDVTISSRQEPKNRDFVDIFGKVGVRYTNTYGNYASEESILFEKQVHEYQRVEIEKEMQLARYWVALPTYSSLLVDLDLTEFGTGRKLANDTMKFLPQQGFMSGDSFLLDDLFIIVYVAWFHSSPMPPQYEKFSRGMKEITTEEMDVDGEDTDDTDGDAESSSSSADDEPSSNLNLARGLHPHRSKPWPSPAVEIFSVLIGRQKSKALHIYGSIEVLSDDDRICFIFKRDQNDAMVLSEGMKYILDVLDGSRGYEDDSLEIKFDIKDLEGRLAIKGYVDWWPSALEESLWRDKQLCNVFQGQDGSGFAAVHYSIFSDAVQANIKVSMNMRTGFADVGPKVCGSVIAQYNCFDYSSCYNKEYYRSVLFRRNGDDSVQLNADSTLPLSRSVVVVPAYSSIVISVNLELAGPSLLKLCTEEIEIKIGEGCKTIETIDCMICIELDWCEIK